jgi:hypothetical protein
VQQPSPPGEARGLRPAAAPGMISVREAEKFSAGLSSRCGYRKLRRQGCLQPLISIAKKEKGPATNPAPSPGHTLTSDAILPLADPRTACRPQRARPLRATPFPNATPGPTVPPSADYYRGSPRTLIMLAIAGRRGHAPTIDPAPPARVENKGRV